MTSPIAPTESRVPASLPEGGHASPAASLAEGDIAGGAPSASVCGGCAATRRWLRGDWTPEWFCAFLAGNRREQTRFRQELATMRGSVAWLLRQRRQGRWNAEERERLRGLMRSASSVSPYLLVWVVPGSMLLLPFMAWFIDWRRAARERAALAVVPMEGGLPVVAVLAAPVSSTAAEAMPAPHPAGGTADAAGPHGRQGSGLR